MFIQELAVKEIEAELMSKQFLYSEAVENIERSEDIIKVVQDFNTIQKIAMQSYEKGLQMGSTRSEKDIRQMKLFVERAEVKKNISLSSRAEMYRLGLLLSYYYLINDTSKNSSNKLK